MFMTSRMKEATAFAEHIKALGFTVYLAESREYGFITDETESRVLSFSFTGLTSISGNYGPPSRESGTGWGMGMTPDMLETADEVRQALYANPPDWTRRGWKYLSTVKQYLNQYGSSSRFTRV